MASARQSSLPETELDRFHKFASTTVHHLREPVRMINIYTEMLQALELAGEAGESLGFLRHSASQMQKLLDGLAEFASVSAGIARVYSLSLNLPLRQALLALNSEIKLVEAVISCDDLPVVPCDFDQMQLVFHHLIRNALQYSVGPKPQISVSAISHPTEWVIQVRDNGPGIAAEFQQRVFELYSRLHGGKSHPGNGLGLAVCKAIVESHKGRIWVESTEGAGATFCFALPHVGIDT